VIGEEARIEEVVEVDEEAERRLPHRETFAGPREPRVALARLGSRASRPQMEIFLGDIQRRCRGPGDGRKPARYRIGLLARVFGNDEVTFVPIREGPDLRDVPVVEAEGADSASLENRVQGAKVLPHPVREHLRLAGYVHRAGSYLFERQKARGGA
jgi:hypothetical protein